MILKHLQEYEDLQNWQLKKPATDLAWAEDVKAESLDLKFDNQLKQMRDSLTEKLPRVEKDLDKFNNWEQVVRYELTNQFIEGLSFDKNGKCEGKTLKQWIDEEFEDRHLFYTWKVAKIQQSIERISKEQDLRERKVVSRKPVGTVYYIDPDNGNDAWDGTTPVYVSGTTGPWKTLDKFTENARSAGDKVIIRRNSATLISNGTDTDHTSSGTSVAPIIVESDYDNVWGDRVDLSVTATAILTFGSKTVTFSADISGVLAVGDWIYADGDDNREFAYEVAVIDGTKKIVTLYLPYKGAQAGAGKTTYNIQNAPIWTLATGAPKFNGDNYWQYRGIKVTGGTSASGGMGTDSSVGLEFIDCYIDYQGTSTTRGTIYVSDDKVNMLFKKCYLLFTVGAANVGVFYFAADTYGIIKFEDCLIETTRNNAGAHLFNGSTVGFFIIKATETEFKTANAAAVIFPSTTFLMLYFLKNCTRTTSTTWTGNNAVPYSGLFVEDSNNVVSKTEQYLFSASSVVSESETGIVRAGGSNKSIKITPTTLISPQSFTSRLKIFEIPIYLTTDQKTITIYFKTEATANWTADPTASELWIELEAWGHAANNYRKITKSTGVVDFNGSTDWQALTVTVAPAQAGVAYLKCYYAKTKEDEKSNIFYCDPLPVIT